jgi:hypothetical protein
MVLHRDSRVHAQTDGRSQFLQGMADLFTHKDAPGSLQRIWLNSMRTSWQPMDMDRRCASNVAPMLCRKSKGPQLHSKRTMVTQFVLARRIVGTSIRLLTECATERPSLRVGKHDTVTDGPQVMRTFLILQQQLQDLSACWPWISSVSAVSSPSGLKSGFTSTVLVPTLAAISTSAVCAASGWFTLAAHTRVRRRSNT